MIYILYPPTGTAIYADSDDDCDTLIVLTTATVGYAAKPMENVTAKEICETPQANYVGMFVSAMQDHADAYWFRHHEIFCRCYKAGVSVTEIYGTDEPIADSYITPDSIPLTGAFVKLSEGVVSLVFTAPVNHDGAVAAFHYLANVAFGDAPAFGRFSHEMVMGALHIGASKFMSGGFSLGDMTFAWGWNQEQDQLCLVAKLDPTTEPITPQGVKAMFEEIAKGSSSREKME